MNLQQKREATIRAARAVQKGTHDEWKQALGALREFTHANEREGVDAPG